jgi:hypothetical protein
MVAVLLVIAWIIILGLGGIVRGNSTALGIAIAMSLLLLIV